MQNGILYGVSVGPGDPELMTLKAVRTIERCSVIAAPETRGDKTLALDIVRGAMDVSGKEIMAISFPMSRDKSVINANYDAVAARIRAELEQGRDVALINLGDVSVYSTFSYIADRLSAQGFAVEIIPGVTSFCAVSAKLGTSLVQYDEMLHVLPASVGDMDAALALPGTKVVMKTGRGLRAVVETLERTGKLDRASMIQNCGLENERICRVIDPAECSEDYFTTMIVKD